MELTRLRRVHRPKAGKLGCLFLSSASESGLLPQRERIPLVVSSKIREQEWKELEWEIRITINQRSGRHYIGKIELGSPDVALEDIVEEIQKVYPERLVGAMLDLQDVQKGWINPDLVESSDFKDLVYAREQKNNGANPSAKRFFEKFEKMCALALGWKDPEMLLQEVEYYRENFSVWG